MQIPFRVNINVTSSGVITAPVYSIWNDFLGERNRYKLSSSLFVIRK